MLSYKITPLEEVPKLEETGEKTKGAPVPTVSELAPNTTAKIQYANLGDKSQVINK